MMLSLGVRAFPPFRPDIEQQVFRLRSAHKGWGTEDRTRCELGTVCLSRTASLACFAGYAGYWQFLFFPYLL
jgi:hypothetical protein